MSRRGFLKGLLGVPVAAPLVGRAMLSETAKGALGGALPYGVVGGVFEGAVPPNAIGAPTNSAIVKAYDLFCVHRDAENALRHARHLDPDIECLRSVSRTVKHRMQLRRDLEDTYLGRALEHKRWGGS